jgi:hypothetical protein
MIKLFVAGVGIYAPGLTGWEPAHAVLAGTAPFTPDILPRLQPALLAPELRRRTSMHVRLAVEVASQAIAHAAHDPATLSSVFVSSEADSDTTHYICEEVARTAPQVSPTRFHNSVNNTAAGYFSMAAGTSMPSTSIASWDETTATGLVEAAAQAAAGDDVLLVVNDVPLPAPLHEHHPFTAPFGAALVLSRVRDEHTLAALSFTGLPVNRAHTAMTNPQLELLRQGNPAAQILPLLAAIAARTQTTVALPYLDGRVLEVEVAR